MKKEPKQKSFCVCQTKRSNQTNDNQYGRYGYDHQADNQHDRMDMIMLTINVVEMNVNIGVMISMVDVEVIKRIVKDMRSADASVAMKDTIFMVMIATYIANTSGEIIRTTLTRSSQNTTNSLEGVVLMFIMLV